MKNKEIKKSEINLHINSLSNAYSSFSDFEQGVTILDDKLLTFVEESAKDAGYVDELELKININGEVNKTECETFKTNFKNYYKRNIEDTKKDILKLNIISWSLLLIGVGLLVILQLLQNIHAPFIIETIMEICAWVFVWEFVDTFFFRKIEHRTKIRFYKLLQNAIITVY